jgi:hypothetical protein
MEYDLIRFRNSGTRVYSGRPEGKNLRQKLDLDKKDEDNEIYTFIIPSDTLSVTPSFFLGAFGPSVIKLRRENFREKYKFTGDPIIVDDILTTYISYALVNNNALCV